MLINIIEQQAILQVAYPGAIDRLNNVSSRPIITDNFIYIVSHDLRSPCFPQGTDDYAKMKIDDREQVLKYLDWRVKH
jgi:hypothetical protein